MKLTKDKKGQGGAVGTLIGLTVGIGVAILVIVFIGLMSGSVFQQSEATINTIASAQTTGDTFTPLIGSYVALDTPYIQSDTFKVVNGSTTLSATNFTLNANEGKFLLLDAQYNNTQLSANYTHGAREVRDAVKESSLQGFLSLKTTTQYMPIVILAVIIGVVLTIVLGFTGAAGMGRNGGGTAL